MSESCTHNCETCSSASGCPSSQKPAKEITPLGEGSVVKRVYAVVSGKGGVGKSLVTSLMAVNMQRKGHNVAVLDADVTGPSIPQMFGVHNKAAAGALGLLPCKSSSGIQLMSVNLLLQNETDPVIWRGPVLSGIIQQFWSEVYWQDVDYMFIDMPPGTGDVPLTVFQTLPVDGIIIVTSPQELVSMIVEKAVKMAAALDVPIVGLVENMSYFECPDCGKRHSIFGESNLDETAKKYSIPIIARLPINPKLAGACDEGFIELYDGDWLDAMADALE